MVLSGYDYAKKVQDELFWKVLKNCYEVFQKNSNNNDFSTYGYTYEMNDFLTLWGVEENIGLWKIVVRDKTFASKVLYFYTDLAGNLLFSPFFFDYATLFSNGCAFVCIKNFAFGSHSFLIDIFKKQILSVPKNIKDVNNLLYNQLAVLDDKTNKWGAYTIDLEAGLWSLDIPFIWDGLALSKNSEEVYVAVLENELDSFQNLMMRYRFASMSKMEVRDFHYFEKFREFYHSGIVTNFKNYCNDYYFFQESRTFDSTNDGTIRRVGDLKDYSLKKTYIKE